MAKEQKKKNNAKNTKSKEIIFNYDYFKNAI